MFDAPTFALMFQLLPPLEVTEMLLKDQTETFVCFVLTDPELSTISQYMV